jgi:hypothetical protein
MSLAVQVTAQRGCAMLAVLDAVVRATIDLPAAAAMFAGIIKPNL